MGAALLALTAGAAGAVQVAVQSRLGERVGLGHGREPNGEV